MERGPAHVIHGCQGTVSGCTGRPGHRRWDHGPLPHDWSDVDDVGGLRGRWCALLGRSPVAPRLFHSAHGLAGARAGTSGPTRVRCRSSFKRISEALWGSLGRGGSAACALGRQRSPSGLALVVPGHGLAAAPLASASTAGGDAADPHDTGRPDDARAGLDRGPQAGRPGRIGRGQPALARHGCRSHRGPRTCRGRRPCHGPTGPRGRLPCHVPVRSGRSRGSRPG